MRFLRILQILTKFLFPQLVITSLMIAQQYGHWEIIDSTKLPRQLHASVVMEDGNVMVTGGVTGVPPYSRSTEVYNVVPNIWLLANPINFSRIAQSMELLQDGSVLAIGGSELNLYSCEKYDPVTGNWEFVGSLNKVRTYGFKTSRLDNGKVLITGGRYFTGSLFKYVKECELYDAITNEWIIVDSLSVGRANHSAALLKDGRVLVTGGSNSGTDLKSCEIFDPVTSQWSLTDSMSIARAGHSSVILPDGKVIVMGGNAVEFTCEIFDPVLETWEFAGNLSSPHIFHSSVPLADSLILLVGGIFADWEIFDLKTFSSMYVDTLPFLKFEPTIHLLPDGRVINIGGWTYNAGLVLPTAICLMYYPPNTTHVLVDEEQAFGYMLNQNYPNPFNPATVIGYQLPVSGNVTLKVFDVLGREIATLVNEYKEAGKHSVEFNATGLPSGIYFYRLIAGSFSETKKMILLR